MFKSKVTKAVCLALALPAFSYSTNLYAQDESEAESSEDSERIVVTGSRIRTDAFANETPIDIISVAEAEEQGLKTLGDLLRTSTSAAGSSQLISALSVGFVTDGGLGAESVSLRGLGASRTLVLLNGRRAGPAGVRGAVAAFDLNVIPLSTIERIEILKDGASSLYGSDAVAGVVNIITKKGDDKTLTFDITQPLESGGETKRVSFSYGDEFERGSYRLTADYRLSSELKRGDRDFFNCTERLYTDEDGNRADPIDPRTGQPHCSESGYGFWVFGLADNLDWSGRPQLQYDYDGFFEENGYLSYNDRATGGNDFLTPDGWYPVSFDAESEGWWDLNHPFRDNESMIPETQTYSLMATGEYQLTDSITAYGELLHSSRTTKAQQYRQFWTADIGFYLPATAFEGFSGFEYIAPVALTDHFGSEATIDYTRGVFGLTGDIGFWTWDLAYQQSYSSGEYIVDIIHRDSMLMAQNHLLNGTSCSGEVTESSGVTCVDVPWSDPQFLYGNHDAELSEFLFGVDKGETTYKQSSIEGYISGDIMELPAGELSGAFGFALKQDEINDVPGEQTLAGNSWGLSSAGITAGEQETKAAYFELRVPLLADKPGVESLTLTTSARYTDVDTFGDDTTFKLGLAWTVVDGFSIRANRGTSFRSPTLEELFLAEQTGFLGQTTTDICYDWGNELEAGGISDLTAANCEAAGIPADYATAGSSIETTTSGGAGRLVAETSVNENIGFVWTSPEDTFAFSMDYYDVVIDDEIRSLSGSNIVTLCYTSLDFANEPTCDQIVRRDGTNGDYGIDTIATGFVNVNTQIARGIDYDFTYTDDFDWGTITFDLEHTMQIERKFKIFEDSVDNNLIGELGNPKHTGRVRLTYEKDDYSFTWTATYSDAVNDYEYYTNGNATTFYGTPVTFKADLEWVTYHTVSGNYEFDNGLDVTVGIANLLDTAPPRLSALETFEVGNAALYSQYDFRGRRLFANLTYDF